LLADIDIEDSPSAKEHEVTESFTVESSCMGFIIGKNGTKIQTVQKETGTQISVRR
jgi:hypothetical protein